MNRQLILPTFAIVATAVVSFGLSALASNDNSFKPATTAPPNGNAYAPLDVGPVANQKQGGLVLGTGGVATGLWIQSGNVGIDTTGLPAKALDINGSQLIEGTNKLGTYGRDPDSGYPSGWNGGVHTWDVYAEDKVGAGSSGGPAAAYLDNAGTVSGSKMCLGSNCITSWPTTPNQDCNQDGYIYSIPDPYMNDWGGSTVNDSLEIYCRNHTARFCLSGENCQWRDDITSDDADTCSASGLTSTGSGGSDIMADAWGYRWQNQSYYYCVPDYNGATGGQIQFTAPTSNPSPTPSGGGGTCRRNCPANP